MRLNTMDKINERKNNNHVYYMYAALAGIVAGVLLIFFSKLSIVLFKLAIQYWYYAIGILFGIIFMRKFFRKKRTRELRSERYEE